MGLLVGGVWHDQWYDTKASGGAFVRSTAKFRNWITADGRLASLVRAVFPQSLAAIISTSAMLALGRIAH